MSGKVNFAVNLTIVPKIIHLSNSLLVPYILHNKKQNNSALKTSFYRTEQVECLTKERKTKVNDL